MIIFDDVWKFPKSRRAKVPLLAGVNCVFEKTGNVAILCQRERDVTLLVNLLTGTEHPDRGRVIRRGAVSWPMGDLVSVKGSLTVRDNLRFVARIYGLDADAFVKYISELADFGKDLNLPMSTLDRAKKQIASYAAVLAVPFDWYVLSSKIKVQEKAVSDIIQAAFRSRLNHASAIVITDDVETALSVGGRGVLFRDGRFDHTESVEHAAQLFLGG